MASTSTDTDRLSRTFFALADPTRRAILARLAHGQARVGDLARPFEISAPAISKHLKVLEHAGLIEREVDAQWRVCRLRAVALRDAYGWLDSYRQFWDESLDRLARYLEDEERRANNEARSKPGRGNRAKARAEAIARTVTGSKTPPGTRPRRSKR